MVVLLVTAMFTASAQKTSDKTAMEEERRKLQLELRQIQAAYDAVKGQSTNALHQLAALNKKIELQERYINNISKEIRLINDDIYYSSLEINRLKKQMDTLKSHYARTVVYAYKNRSNYDYLNFIFSANSFNDAIKRVAYLKNYRNYRKQQMDDILKTSELISKRYNQQLESKKRKQFALDKRSEEIVVLDQQRKEKDSVARMLQSQAGQLQRQIARKKEQDRQLKNNIAAVVRKEIEEARKAAQEEARKRAEEEAKARKEELAKKMQEDVEKALTGATATITPPKNEVVEETPVASAPATSARQPRFDRVNPSTTTTVKNIPGSSGNIVVKESPVTVPQNHTPPSTAVATTRKEPEGGYLNYKADDIALNSDFSQNRGKLPPPVDGVITLGFGRYKIEGLGPAIVGDNPGVTYTAPVGAPVRAVFNGEVVSVSKVSSTSFVVIRHGKYFTAYSNLASVSVSRGASISRGQTIGTVGADEETGTGKLDFILMIEERNVDPRPWLRP